MLVACLLLSLGLNASAIVGVSHWWNGHERRIPVSEWLSVLDIFPKLKPEEPEPIEIALENVELPPELERKLEEKEKDKPKPEEKEKPEPEIELEELPELEPEPEPEPEKEEEKEEEEKEEEDPPDFELTQMKMVEQPDSLDEEKEPLDADFLSNINNNTPENTQAKITNLDKDAVDPKASQIEPSEKKDEGTANEKEIAQDKTKESRLDKQAPREKVSPQEERREQNDPNPKSLLAMRETEQLDHKLPQEEHEAMVDEADDGVMQSDQSKQSAQEAQDRQARVDKKDKANKFKLSQNQLEALYGKDKVAKRDTESAKESKQEGVWEKQRERYQSPLENFVPEVQPGNQTALRSRKHPFARYIARMHRKIHEAWAWGFLEQLDGRGRNHPLNDFDLWTRVEIVINGDGTIDKVITVRHSGKTAFDAAAREIIFAAGPFPDPPESIRSPNGKIYMHWAFHRDTRACGTFGADPFILDGSSSGGDRPDPNRRVRAGKESAPRRLKRKPKAKGPEGPAAPPRSGGGHDHDHDHDHDGEAEPAPSPAPRPSLTPDPDTMVNDPEAQKQANAWLSYFHKKAVDRVVAKSTLPFKSGDQVVARTRNELKELVRTMVEEAEGKKPKKPKLFTAAGLRKVFGSVPAGVSEGSGRVYALTKVGGDFLILVLEKKFGAYKVVGIAR